MPKYTTEFAWVVEAGPEPVYWDGQHWTTNHMRAIRCCRKVDADRIMLNLPTDARRPDMKTAEHGWDTA